MNNTEQTNFNQTGFDPQQNQNPMPNFNQQQVVYAQPMPVAQLKTNRGLLKFFLLSLITLGIYGLVVMAHVSEDTNIVCSRYDGKKTMNFWLLFFLVGPITLEIAAIVWMHKLCARIGNEANRRGLDCNFGAKSFWLWNVLGAIIVVGPFIFYHKLFKTMNVLNQDFNTKG